MTVLDVAKVILPIIGKVALLCIAGWLFAEYAIWKYERNRKRQSKVQSLSGVRNVR